MTKIILRTFTTISEGYSFLNKITLQGHEPLQLLPTDGGCLLIAKVKSPTDEAFIELNDNVLKAYLGLNDGKVEKNIAVIDVKDLNTAFKLAQELNSKGLTINEIRNFKNIGKPGYLVVSHNDKNILKEYLKSVQHTVIDSNNLNLMNFLGFSNIAVN